jgi:hypothetical protein
MGSFEERFRPRERKWMKMLDKKLIVELCGNINDEGVILVMS